MIYLKKRLRRASFKGAWFYLTDTQTETGRRIVKYEFPFQDRPSVVDLGKVGQVIGITGFVVGANYRSDAENLIKQCESPEAGELFHPYYGTRKVVAKSCRVTENNLEGGIIYFTLQFIETVDTSAITSGLANLPLVGAIIGADTLANASRFMSNVTDSASQGVGYIDQLTDAVLMSAEVVERCFSPLLHASDAITNLALAYNGLLTTSKKVAIAGTVGLAASFSFFLSVVAGTSLDDVDPYHWTQAFPIDPFDPKMYKGTAVLIVGHQASHVLSRLTKFDRKRKVIELQQLKKNIDRTLAITEDTPSLYDAVKKLHSIVTKELFDEATKDPFLLNDQPIRKCLLLEAYDERGGISSIEQILNQYKYGSTLFV